jgi:hypothetical protein
VSIIAEDFPLKMLLPEIFLERIMEKLEAAYELMLFTGVKDSYYLEWILTLQVLCIGE